MVDIPVLASATAAPPVVSAVPPATVVPVAVVPASISDQLQNLMRQLELTGTIAQPPTQDVQSFTINTVLGQLTLQLPQLASGKQDQLLQQLTTLFDAQKPITVMLQPGSPPSQATLILPPSVTVTPPQGNVPQTPLPPQVPVPLPQIIQQTLPQVIATRTPLTAIVLPQNISWPQMPVTVLTTPDSSKIAQYNTPYNAPYAPSPGQQLGPQLSVIANATPSSAANVSTILQAAVPQPGNAQAVNAQPPQNFIARVMNFLSDAPLDAPTHQGLPVLPNAVPNSATTLPQASPAFPDRAASTIPTAPLTPGVVATLPPGREVTATIIAAQGNNAPPIAPSSLPPQTLSAVVTGQGPNGEAIITLSNTQINGQNNGLANTVSLYIKNAPPMDVGTTVYVTLSNVPEASAAMQPLPVLQDPAAQSLQTMVAALGQADSNVAQQFVQNMIFQPNDPLPTALLLFMSAFKPSNPTGWVGHDVTSVMTRSGKAAVLNKVFADMGQAAAPAHDQTVGQWQSYPVPVLNNSQMQIAHFYIHQNPQQGQGDHQEATAASKSEHLRFLIDLTMTKLGAVQIDGLVQRRKLDVIVRSDTPLSPMLQQELRQSYSSSMGAIDYSGSLAFQEGRQNWLTMQRMDMKSLIT